ncbi:hypothetical protein [Pseudolactococcus paracarnosus]|uniref:Uncharacterized protein n=1 Tax=Pseudolactococcus paracarnosus TaxID=2749962 RepID=A0ABT0AL05_9LACT|nr:hypothetical protein [Lactococcus paracarnosus]MCJ1977232.1 hypothetical protein [Lactococcus paracarnosus]MCJ1983272.1 hypothetical protein [Lactococcus paracarnosus]MCJ1998082.1 hypothetical protein [Lactococcus paracarnosus]
MAVFKREKLIDISKRSEGGALVKRLESEIKELDREVSVLESELGRQVRENEQLKQELKHSDKGPSSNHNHDAALAESNHEIEKLSSLIDQYELQIKYLQEKEIAGLETVNLSSTSPADHTSDALFEENQQLKREIDLILTQTVDEQDKLIAKLQTELAKVNDKGVSDQGQLIEALSQQIDLQEKELIQAQEREVAFKRDNQDVEASNVEALQVLVEELQGELSELAQTLVVKESALADAKAHIATLNSQLSDERQAHTLEVSSMAASLETQVSEHEQTLAACQDEIAQMTQTIADLSKASDLQVQELDALSVKLSEKEIAILTLKSDLTAQVSDLEATQNELTEQNISLSMQLISVSQKLDEEQSKTVDLKSVEEQLALALQDTSQATARSQELSELLDSKTQELADLSNKLTDVTESYTDQHIALQSQLVSVEQEMALLIADEETQRQAVEALRKALTQKEQECSDKDIAMVKLESALSIKMSELEAVQQDLSDQNTALSMALTSASQKGYEEQSKTTQLQAELSELRLQQQSEVADWEQLLSEKEAELIAEKTDLSALTQELIAVRSTYQTLQDKNLTEKTKIQEEMAAADRKIVSLRQEISDIGESKGHQVSLLQSIISDNKSLVLQLDQKIEQGKLDNQRLSEESHQKVQQLQAVIQEQDVKLSEANNQNNLLEAELLEKEATNKQELSDTMLMISRLKHEVLEEANIEIDRKREQLKQEEQALKVQLKREASDLLSEIEGFKDKFIGTIDFD